VPAIIVVLWLAGAVVTWNMVFDAHIVKGARDYVDRQQRFIEGRGPRQDMESAMTAARSSGLMAASAWTAAELLSGVVPWVVVRCRRRGRPAASR
jgi:hypothetical protein